MKVIHQLTIGDLARENARSWPQATAIVDGDMRLTYPELNERSTRLANVLAEAGIGAGGRVMWLGLNSFRVLETLIAAGKLGANLCVANSRLSADEVEFVFKDFNPDVVIWKASDAPDSLLALREASGPAVWIAHDSTEPESYEDRIASASASDVELPVDGSTALVTLYTAAFDGRPNAAQLSHLGIVTHNLSLALQRQVEPGFVYLNAGPLFHVGTLMWMTMTFHLGGTNVFMPSFDAVEACRLVEAERCQATIGFPVMLEEMAKANADHRYDLTSLRTNAGSDLWNSMITIDISPWGRGFAGYGQTEVGGMLTYAGLGTGGIGSHGRPSPLAQVRIVDEGDVEVAQGDVGQLVARGPHVMVGYHNRPDLNAQKMAGDWHHTGDLGRRESDGTITFIGPRNRMIKSAGENIYAAEVERAIATHPAVKQVAVIGYADAQWDQSVRAIVATHDGAEVSEKEIVDHCRQAIASYKKPRSVVFVDSIPMIGFVPDYDQLDADHDGGGYPGYGQTSTS